MAIFYYLKSRKKGSAKVNAVRKDGRILVFNNDRNVKKYIEESGGELIYEVVMNKKHPSNKSSSIYGKRYEKVGW